MAEFRYTGKGPIKVFFLFSGGASSMEAVLDDPNHGRSFLVVGASCNRDYNKASKGYELAAKIDDLSETYIDPSQHDSRKSYYDAVLERIKSTGADVIGLSGWLGKYSLIPPSFLDAFPNRIINVHPADLSILAHLEGNIVDMGRKRLHRIITRFRDSDYKKPVDLVKKHGWKRVFTGDDAVNLAVLYGEEEVCSTIHSVTEEPDGGPNLVQSERKRVDRDRIERWLQQGMNSLDKVAGYSHKLQDEMKIDCDGPAFCKALELIGTGKMGIDDDHATLDGKPLPYSGYQMGSDVGD